MQCNMCGKDTKLITAEIEGTRLEVCETCASYGKKINKPRMMNFKYKPKIEKKEPLLIILEEYSKLIRQARDKLKLNQEQFAKKLNERTSVIHNLEIGKIKPSIKLAKKLEKTLSIKLIEEIKEKDEIDISPNKANKNSALTIGDLIKVRKK